MTVIPWWEWLRRSDAHLAQRLGVSVDVVKAERIASTGHDAPLRGRGLLTVGMWGGCRSVADTHTAYGVPRRDDRETRAQLMNRRRQFMHYWGLKTTPSLKYFGAYVQPRLPQFNAILIAIDLLRHARTRDEARLDAVADARSYGILPAEATLYYHNAITIEEDLYERTRLKRLWDVFNEYTPTALFTYVIRELPLYWNLPYAIAVETRQDLGIEAPPRLLYIEPNEVLDVAPQDP